NEEKSGGRQYWESTKAYLLGGVPPDAGFANISKIDLQNSRAFLAELGIGSTHDRRAVKIALEGGAGTGRVTEGLLSNIAEHIDVVEPVVKFTAGLQGKSKVRTVFNVGLDKWQSTEGVYYDLIWTQWCVGYLADSQLIDYLKHCKAAVTADTGIIVLKENLSFSDEDYVDPVDGSVTRSEITFQEIIREAGLNIIRMDTQRGLPKKLFPVRMYAMKPHKKEPTA
ncbi:hypothetical protein PG993_010463, partial [Apiospora rasikravindrae]